MNTNQKEAMAAENQVSSTEVKANGVCKGLMSEQRTEQEVINLLQRIRDSLWSYKRCGETMIHVADVL
jgi:hypothetical protein